MLKKFLAKAKEKFLARVDVRGPDECWEWQGSRHWFGHGHYQYEGTVQYTHRVSWQLHNGPIPKNMKVLHHCDNPACVNPNHLFLGTQADNVDDMIAKGRNSPPPHLLGEDHWNVKLTEDDVRQIRKMILEGYSSREIADHFNVAKPTIKDIKAGRTWRHVQ